LFLFISLEYRMNNLHPIMAQALAPWMPMPTPAELDEQRLRRREEYRDECRTGLDCVDPDGERDDE
jgi:hypothetical protein